MGEVVLQLMISANDPPKYKVALSPLAVGQEKTLHKGEGHSFKEERDEPPTQENEPPPIFLQASYAVHAVCSFRMHLRASGGADPSTALFVAGGCPQLLGAGPDFLLSTSVSPLKTHPDKVKC